MNSFKRLIYGAVAITAPLFISCSSVPQTLSTNTFYKRDLKFTVNGNLIDGAAVVDPSDNYTIGMGTDEEISLLLFRTCHREVSFEKVGCTGGLFKKKSCFSYNFIPVPQIEKGRGCPLKLEAYKSDNGKHGWGLLETRDEHYRLDFGLTCNGEVSVQNGVGLCQARSESTQVLRFSEPIQIKAQDGCEMPKKVGDSYELSVSKGECFYIFETKEGVRGRLLVLGFEGILVRENP